MRIVHISDLHFWHITLDPRRLLSKRIFGMGNLILNRARKYRMETMPRLVERVASLEVDHLLVTGDLTTTALDEEFAAVRRALTAMIEPGRLTVIPGNHDRYTRESARARVFERYFGDLAPQRDFPWLKWIGDDTAILALDPTHPNPISAFGTISSAQLDRASAILGAGPRPRRLLVACHYPVALPAGIAESRGHGLRGVRELRTFLARTGPSLYCHGHIHATWAFQPQILPGTLCLDPGAALKIHKRSGVTASMLEIELQGSGVEVRRHRLRSGVWETDALVESPAFFGRGRAA